MTEHQPGEILPEPTICDCWIDRQGRQHFVPPCGHNETALTHLNRDPHDLEQEGWIHLSLFAYGYIIVRSRFTPSARQTDIMFDLMMLAERNQYSHPKARQMYSACCEFMELIKEDD